MNDKEIRKLNRSQLIEIIYQLQLNQEELEEENKKLKEALEDKRLHIKNAGNLAYAALELNKVMEAAQNAADMYLNEIREIRKETEAQCIHILKTTKEKADAYLNALKSEDVEEVENN